MDVAELSLYCLADSRFYDTFDNYRPQTSDFLVYVERLLNKGWACNRSRLWYSCRPTQSKLPDHGWKIHCSSILEDANELLNRVIPILVEHEISFKFALDKGILGHLNSKRWPRGNANKFITIYPTSLLDCKKVIQLIAASTRGLRGPYILSDRRYRDSSVVYYRYGGFIRKELTDAQGVRLSILNMKDGTTHNDERQAYFILPPGITDPFLENSASERDQMDDSDAPTLNNGRYSIQSSLAFSNAGGVYLAHDSVTQKTVVIKEARPYIGEFAPGIDAQALLRKEFRLLSKINDSAIAPKVIELFLDWEHLYLVQEYLEGTSFTNYCAAQGSPILSYVENGRINDFYVRFREIMIDLTTILQSLHSKSIIFGDLSPNNIIVKSADGRPLLIDFEGAYDNEETTPINLCTPGFGSATRMADSVLTPPTESDDLFALGAIMLSYILPINTLLSQKEEAPWLFLDSVERQVGIPSKIKKLILGLLNPTPNDRPDLASVLRVLRDDSSVPNVIAGAAGDDSSDLLLNFSTELSAHILARATPGRLDRLYPSDPSLFQTNPLSISYGAAGVIYALARTGYAIPIEQMEWLTSKELKTESYPANLAIGMAGVAWTLAELDRLKEATALLQVALDHPTAYDESGLFYGAAGLGLSCLNIYNKTSQTSFLDHAIAIGQQLMSVAQVENGTYFWPSGQDVFFGLARGASGIALLFTYLAAVTKFEEFGRFARLALEFDLNNGIPWEDRGIQWQMQRGSSRTIYPYWDYGSAGVGASLVRYCSVFPDTDLRLLLPKVIIGARKRYTVFPGFSRGISGIGMFLMDMYQFTSDESFFVQAQEVADKILLFGVNDTCGVGIPGERLLRLSCDLSTGAAGVLLYIDRLINKRGAPFLPDELLASAYGTVRLS